MHLERASLTPPPGLADLLTRLGPDGEAGFSGTPFGRGECSLPEFLRTCVDGADPAKLQPGLVPQTIFWMIDNEGTAVGVLRLRHPLNPRLLQAGGHIGYYVHPAHRGRGYATRALGLALDHLRALGVPRALLTVEPTNVPSTRVVLAHGGTPDGQAVEPNTGHVVTRYWIDLTTPHRSTR